MARRGEESCCLARVCCLAATLYIRAGKPIGPLGSDAINDRWGFQMRLSTQLRVGFATIQRSNVRANRRKPYVKVPALQPPCEVRTWFEPRAPLFLLQPMRTHTSISVLETWLGFVLDECVYNDRRFPVAKRFDCRGSTCRGFPSIGDASRCLRLARATRRVGRKIGASNPHAYEDRIIPAMIKIKHPRMLKKSIDDTDHGNVLTLAGNTRSQAAYTSNIEPDNDSGLARLVECIDDIRIHQ